MKYVNKAGQVYGGSKPDDMSDDEYEKMMAKKGYYKKGGHSKTEPDPKKNQKAPLNEGNPSEGISKSADGEEEVEMTELTKALNQLTSLVKSKDPEDRKQSLLQKSMNEDLSQEETQELMSLLAGQEEGGQEEGLSKSALAALDPASNETLEKSIEVSDYLKAHHGGTVEALDVLSDAIEKSQAKNDEFQLVLAKAIVQVGRSLEDLQKSIDGWGSQPAGRPRAAQTARQAATQTQTRPLEKSMGGVGGSQEGRLDRTQVMNVLEAMHQDSISKGMGGSAPCGEDLSQAITKYEQFNKMSRPLYNDVVAYVGRASA